MSKKRVDRLSTLIQHFRVKAKVLPKRVDGSPDGEEHEMAANLFIFGQGRLDCLGKGSAELEKNAPVLVFFPRGAPSDFRAQTGLKDTKYISASVDTGGELNPIAQALPDVVRVPLDEAKSLQAVTDILLEEALSPRCGGHAVIDRLCEIVVIRLLRHLIEDGQAKVGLIAGLAHPNLSPAIVAIHDHPERLWRLEDLANIAAMSRTHFANTFRKVVGVTPGEYLSSWRLALARMEIAKGTSLKSVVGKVGFSSSAALSRAFKRRYGVTPRQDQLRSA
ncbi:MAG: helix-turn-helix transcriptional regulator [Magnetovibrio sp.]|nr:helix-turn-helix transcriptional regulator [Magnetovibrio sp.]